MGIKECSEQQKLAPTTGAVAWTIYIADRFDVDRIDIHLDVAPTSAGDITITKDAAAGAAYDTVMHEFTAVGETDHAVENLKGFVSGDKVLVEYANPDSRTISGTANVSY